jgi:hypothetical protein
MFGGQFAASTGTPWRLCPLIPNCPPLCLRLLSFGMQNAGPLQPLTQCVQHAIRQSSRLHWNEEPITASALDGELIRYRSYTNNSILPLFFVLGLTAVLVVGCDLVPQKPDAVFVLFRDRMNQGKVTEARDLMTPESRDLALTLKTKYRLADEPETLGLLSSLNPESQPVVVKGGEDYAVLQVRRLSGDPVIVRLIREDPKAGWKIDLKEELQALESFLEGREALDMLRELSGDFADAWKNFYNQRKRIRGEPTNTESDKNGGSDQSPSTPKDKNKRPNPKQ